MSQKTNKVIILIFFIVIVAFIISIIVSRHYFEASRIPTGEIKGVVSGQSYDVQVPDMMLLSNINLSLIDESDPETIFRTKTNSDGSFVFSDVPSIRKYWIEIDSSQAPASYYVPYKGRILLLYNQASISKVIIKLSLNKRASRDLLRQQSVFLYASLLNDYQKDHGNYPITLGDEQNININPHFISLLEPYLKKVNMEANNLLDPIPERVFHYRSGGVHYWLSADPEIVFDVPLFDKKENAYLIHR